jgi:hypothetical protein
MVNYTNIAIGSGILLIVGAVLIAVSNSVVIPGPYRTFLGIPYETNPEYSLALMLKGGLMIFGIVFLVSAALYAVGQLALGQIHLPQPSTLGAASPPIYCIYCGAENQSKASFCQRCGKRIETKGAGIANQ